jgi:hypothetical protein
MSTGTIVIIVIAVVVILALAAFVLQPQMKRRRLRATFGPEYDRTVAEKDDRREAERELSRREQRHAKLELRPLPAAARQQYTEDWTKVQEQFVDDPARAVGTADSLVTSIMAERGYPTEGYDQQLADLSVEHASTMEHYRAAHDITVRHNNDAASTEDLRKAMVHYRELFEDLLRHGTADDDAVDTADERTGDGVIAPEDELDRDEQAQHGPLSRN